MSHTTAITESQVRHVDEYYQIKAAKGGGDVYFNDLSIESQARHVDEYRLAEDHAEESF